MASLSIEKRISDFEASNTYDSIYVEFLVTEAVGLDKNIFLFEAVPKEYNPASDVVEKHLTYRTVCTVLDMEEYPIGDPSPRCIYAYDLIDFMNSVFLANPDRPRSVELLYEHATEQLKRDSTVFPYCRLDRVGVLLNSTDSELNKVKSLELVNSSTCCWTKS
jgi:hypothetical protein